MNIVFWLIVATMLLAALLIVVLPVIRKHLELAADDTDQRNIQIARDRLAELKANKAAGGISQAQYDEQVAELELALSDDLDNIGSKQPAATQGRWLAYVLIVGIPLLSITLYWQLGDYQAIGRVNEPQQDANAGNQAMPNMDDINKMVAKLAAKMQSDPNNLEGWLMLGRSYKMLQRFPEAIEAFEHAYRLSDKKPEILLPYAETLALAKNGDWAGKPMELIDKTLSIEPNNLPALWFAAVAKAQQGDKLTAVSYLRKLDALLPDGSSDKQQIQDLIASTEKETQNSKQTSPAQAAKAATVSVEVDVSIAPDLLEKVHKEGTVFIYAQAESGPKMPLAIVKKQVQDLPGKITLSDADGMMPQMKLSDFKQVRLVARISKSGNAMPQSGDFIGEIAQAKLADRSHKIVINHPLD